MYAFRGIYITVVIDCCLYDSFSMPFLSHFLIICTCSQNFPFRLEFSSSFTPLCPKAAFDRAVGMGLGRHLRWFFLCFSFFHATPAPFDHHSYAKSQSETRLEFLGLHSTNGWKDSRDSLHLIWYILEDLSVATSYIGACCLLGWGLIGLIWYSHIAIALAFEGWRLAETDTSYRNNT